MTNFLLLSHAKSHVMVSDFLEEHGCFLSRDRDTGFCGLSFSVTPALDYVSTYPGALRIVALITFKTAPPQDVIQEVLGTATAQDTRNIVFSKFQQYGVARNQGTMAHTLSFEKAGTGWRVCVSYVDTQSRASMDLNEFYATHIAPLGAAFSLPTIR